MRNIQEWTYQLFTKVKTPKRVEVDEAPYKVASKRCLLDPGQTNQPAEHRKGDAGSSCSGQQRRVP